MAAPQIFRPDFRPVGPSGTVLCADSSQPYGVAWKYNSSQRLIASLSETSGSAFIPQYYLAGTGILNPLVGLGYSYTPSGLNIRMPSGTYVPTGIVPYFNVSGGIPALAVGIGTGIIFNMTGICLSSLKMLQLLTKNS